MDIYGIIGWPVEHSLSPPMHNAAFKALGVDAEYRKFEVRPEELEEFLLNRKDVVGFNITVPHKVKAKEILEVRFPLERNVSQMQEGSYYVKVTGAVNTVKRNKDRLGYWNSDPYGFIRSLEEDLQFNTENKNVLLLGCGGAGRAVVSGLSWKQARINRIYVYEKDKKINEVAQQHFLEFYFAKDKVKFISDKEIPDIIRECQLLVNASPVGMEEGCDSVIDKKMLHKGLSVYDVVYNRETELIRDAKSLGLRATGGRGMLLHQGGYAFELWTGAKAPIDVMREALNDALKKKEP